MKLFFLVFLIYNVFVYFFFFSSRRRHTRLTCDWSSDVCSSDLACVLSARPSSAARIWLARSEGIRRAREQVELEERGTPHPHLAQGTALIRAAEKRTIRVDRREKAAPLEAQREMRAHRHAHAKCERYREARVFVTEGRIRADARDPQTAREIRLYALHLIERHCAAEVQIFDVDSGGGEGISPQ